MWRLIFVGCLALLACESDDLYSSVCDQPCYEGPLDEVGVGICQAGHTVCSRGIVVACVDSVGRQVESCNGIDDDCDGVVDDNLMRPCSTIAGTGVEVCEAGDWVRCTAPVPQQETCNGIDDDFNGSIDDGLSPLRPCYGSNLDALRWPKSGCHAGVEVCENGIVRCVNATYPTAEICGNGIDDDCDGQLDEANGGQEPKPVDLTLVVDRSCSMFDKIPRVRTVLLEFFLTHPSPQYMYSFVDVPGPNTDQPLVNSDFVDGTQAASVAASLTSDYGGTEASYDAFTGIGYGTLQPLTWRPNSYRVLIWLGDEDGQTNRNWTEGASARALGQANILFIGFVVMLHYGDYDDIAAATGGRVYDIMASLDKIRDIFFTAVVPTCIE